MNSKSKPPAPAPRPPLHEQYLARLKSQRVVAVLIVVGSVVIGLASFTDAAKKLLSALPSAQRPEDARQALIKLSLPYTPTAFVDTAAAGDAVAVKLYLAAGMPVDEESGRDPTTALVEAARANRPEIVTQLLDAKADIERRVPQRGSVLEAAVAAGNRAVVDLLLARKPSARAINAAFIDAAFTGQADMLRLLQQHGADPAQLGTRALFSAVDNARPPEPAMADAVSYLLQHGADAKATDGDDRATPLHRAARGGHAAVVAALLQYGAPPDAKDTDGRTPLWWAAGVGRSDNVALLLSAGADAKSRDREGTSVLDRAKHNGIETLTAQLIAHGAR